MNTPEQHKAYNENRLLKAAIKRNVEMVIGMIPREKQAELIRLEGRREEAVRAVRELESEVANIIGGIV
jgi:hypothetical protein